MSMDHGVPTNRDATVAPSAVSERETRSALLVTLVRPFVGDQRNPVSRTRGVPEPQRNRAVSRICRADASRKLSSD